MQRLGYHTALIGKWHLHIDPTGFDYWNILPGQGVYRNPKLLPMGEKKARRTYTGGYSDGRHHRPVDRLAQEARQGQAVLALCCHFKAPHRPWDPAPRFEDLYKDETIPEPETLLDDYKGRSKAVGKRQDDASARTWRARPGDADPARTCRATSCANGRTSAT